jgi:hypothetical protein
LIVSGAMTTARRRTVDHLTTLADGGRRGARNAAAPGDAFDAVAALMGRIGPATGMELDHEDG